MEGKEERKREKKKGKKEDKDGRKIGQNKERRWRLRKSKSEWNRQEGRESL